MTTEIAKLEECSLVIPKGVPTGFEDLDMTDLPVPRLRLVQASSKSFKAGISKLGQFENSITQQLIDGPIELVPIRAKRGALYMEKGKGFKCKSEDGVTSFQGDLCSECPYMAYWKLWKDGNPPLCGATVDMVVVDRKTILDPVPMVMMLTFTKKAHKIGQNALSMFLASGKPMYARAFMLGSMDDKGSGQDFKNFTVKPSTFLNQQEFDEIVKHVVHFKDKKLNVDDHSIEDVPSAPEDKSNAAPPADDF